MEAAASDPEKQMEAAAEAVEIAKWGMKEAAEGSEVKSVAAKSTAFLSFLARLHKYRCTIF